MFGNAELFSLISVCYAAAPRTHVFTCKASYSSASNTKLRARITALLSAMGFTVLLITIRNGIMTVVATSNSIYTGMSLNLSGHGIVNMSSTSIVSPMVLVCLSTVTCGCYSLSCLFAILICGLVVMSPMISTSNINYRAHAPAPETHVFTCKAHYCNNHNAKLVARITALLADMGFKVMLVDIRNGIMTVVARTKNAMRSNTLLMLNPSGHAIVCMSSTSVASGCLLVCLSTVTCGCYSLACILAIIVSVVLSMLATENMSECMMMLSLYNSVLNFLFTSYLYFSTYLT